MTKDTETGKPAYTKLDDDKTPRQQAKDKWSNAEETLTEPPAGSPKADDQARKS